MKYQVDAIQWGGVVAEFFCGLQSRRDSVGGGGVVSEFLCGLQNPGAIHWGGGSTMHWGPFTFLGFPKGGPGPPRPPLVCMCVRAHESVCLRALTLITILVVATEYIVTVFTGSVGTDAPKFSLWGDNLATHLTTMRGPFQANSYVYLTMMTLK